MRLRHKTGAEEDVLKSSICINTSKYKDANTPFEKLSSKDIFGNNNPLYLELGMGKGRFITEMSKIYSNINFIGIEKSATIVLKAINNLKNDISPVDNNDKSSSNTNLRFMCEDIVNLCNILKGHSINKIFLNFSDPWPKKRHEHRRLTHVNFLNIYKELLIEGGSIEFKTDNKELFDFSISEFNKTSFKIISSTYDLHNDKELNVGNIMTEYEEKFSKLGNKICKLVAII